MTVLLALDTATPSTVVGLTTPRLPDPAEARDDPPAGARPGHTAQVLGLAEGLLRRAGIGFADVERIAVGVGPGSFTGLRIGIATARGLALASGAELVPVSTLRALAIGAEAEAGPDAVVLAVLDARRGEAFTAAWRGGGRVLSPRPAPPERLAELARAGGASIRRAWVGVGDGALRFRGDLERAGVSVPPDASPLHRVGAAALCRLGAEGAPVPSAAVLPEYLREPDAEVTLRARREEA